MNNENWYTIQNLADWCGYDVETLKHGAMNMNEMNVNSDVNTRKAGYHNTQIYYLSKTDVLRLRKDLQDELYMQNAIEDAAGKIAGEIA